MPAALREWLASRYQTPLCVVRIDGTTITGNVVSVDVTMGTEQQSATAVVRFSAEAYPPTTWLPRTPIEVRLGYAGVGGGTLPVFVGEIEDVDARFLPYTFDVNAAGFLKRLQRNAGNTLASGDPADVNNTPVASWSGATDSQIWADLMRLGGVPTYVAGDGDARTIAGPVTLVAGDDLRAVVDELDQASESGQRTFEYAGTVYRTAALRVPLATPPWIYQEGNPTAPVLPLLALERQQSDRDVKNQVIVSGKPQAGTPATAVVGAVRQQESVYWGRDGAGHVVYVPFTFSSRFLETRAQCDAVAVRYMIEHDKVTDVVHLRTPLNPYARPSLTVGVISDRMGRRTMAPYWVRQVAHHWGAEGATTDWSLEGGAGDTGYLVGLPPIALFTMRVTRETYQVGGTPTTIYTVACDASASYDPDGTALAYAWSSASGGSGSGVTFSTTFTAAQWADTTTPPTITLTVTDSDTPDPHTGTTGPVDARSSDAGQHVRVIAMYVAADATAYATPDGWETVGAWTPGGGAHVLCVGRIAAEGTNYLGLSTGHVFRTADYLATAPTDVGWTAPAAVNAVWMSELDTNIVAVGLANGDFWVTKDAFVTAPTLTRNFGNPVQWINGSAQVRTQWRACVGQDVWYTDDDFVGARVLVSFAGLTTAQNELTAFANYAAAAGAAGDPVLKREGDGFPIPFPSVSPAPAAARMTAFIDTDTLLVGDDQGRSYLGEPASTGGTLVAAASVGYGAVHDLLRDNTNDQAAYAACETALAKTFDRGASWVRVLTLDGTTTRGLRLGYDSAPLTPPLVIATDQLLERTFHRNTNNDWPAGQNPGDTSGMDLWNPYNEQDSEGRRNDPPPTNWYRTDYAEADYTPALWTHTWQSGDRADATYGVITNLSFAGESQDYDAANDAWIRSESNTYHNSIPSGWSGQPGPGIRPWALFRVKFVLPALTLTKALYQVSNSATSSTTLVLEAYANDTAIASPNATQYLDPALFVADGATVNVLALLVQAGGTITATETGGPRPAVAVKLAFGAGADTVSLFTQAATAKLVWAATGEGSCVLEAAAGSPWYAPIVGTITPGDARAGADPGDKFIGIYAEPWPDPWHNLPGKKLANQNGSLTASGTFVHKQAIDMPAGADTAWWLYLRKSDHAQVVDDVYLNGTRLAGTGTPVSPADDPGAHDPDHLVFRYAVGSGAVVMGGRDTLAIRCHDRSGLAWYLVQQ